MKKKIRQVEIFSLSFLDVVSCGFGAIILLLVLIKVSEPQVTEMANSELHNQIDSLQQDITTTQEEVTTLSQNLDSTTDTLEAEIRALETLRQSLAKEIAAVAESRKSLKASELINTQLESARQNLTEEMRRLQQNMRSSVIDSDSLIGGVPVDSEYIIFVIDTSGSMQANAWPLVRKKMQEILDIYPQVKGLQVMNDMGDYMFSQYKRKWIRDTPSRRKSIIRRLSSWNAFSNSSPEEGVAMAIQHFYAADKKISIYIFGDDFSRGSIQGVVDTVARINRTGKEQGRVRIHAVGFPVLLSEQAAQINVARFAALMRKLAEDNNGSFVGLPSLNN